MSENELREYRPIHPQSPLRELGKKLATPLVLVALLAWKAKGVFLALAKVKGAATIGSAFVSVAAYAWIWGWMFAVGFVALLLVHEAGHALVLRRQGVKTSPILFVPFLGAFIGMKQMPRDAWREAQVALAGPILGSVGAAACLGVAVATFAGFLLNLFNLIPVVPLDGGRALAALHPFVWLVGALALVAVTVYFQAWLVLAIVALIGGPELVSRLRRRDAEASYYALPASQRVVAGLAYLVLAGVLAAAAWFSYLPRDFDGSERDPIAAAPAGEERLLFSGS
jgi:Zn-dependent protease